MGVSRSAAVLLVSALAACAQTVDIFSEFHRLDPFGAVVPADRGAITREILSPGVARNGYATFHIAISVPPKESYFLYVATNPVTACRVDLYREHFVKTADGWVPDKLAAVERLPDFGVMPDPDEGIEGQTTRLYLLDLWIPPDADVDRFRLEVQLKMGDWTIRPMEVRVLPARVPDIPAAPEGSAGGPTLPPVEAGADCPAIGALADYLAGIEARSYGKPRTLREAIRRNAVQDMALGRTLQPWGAGPEGMLRNSAMLWLFPRILGSEWYLRFRDLLNARFRF